METQQLELSVDEMTIAEIHKMYKDVLSQCAALSNFITRYLGNTSVEDPSLNVLNFLHLKPTDKLVKKLSEQIDSSAIVNEFKDELEMFLENTFNSIKPDLLLLKNKPDPKVLFRLNTDLKKLNLFLNHFFLCELDSVEDIFLTLDNVVAIIESSNEESDDNKTLYVFPSETSSNEPWIKIKLSKNNFSYDIPRFFNRYWATYLLLRGLFSELLNIPNVQEFILKPAISPDGNQALTELSIEVIPNSASVLVRINSYVRDVSLTDLKLFFEKWQKDESSGRRIYLVIGEYKGTFLSDTTYY